MRDILIQIQREIDELQGKLAELETREQPVIACDVYNNANIIHTNTGNWQTLTFNSEMSDPYGMHSTSINTERVIAPLGGWYLATGHLVFAANTTGMRGLMIQLNGATLLAVDGRNAQSSGATWISIACLSKLDAGDYLTMMGYQSSGGNLDMLYVSRYSPFFRVIKLP